MNFHVTVGKTFDAVLSESTTDKRLDLYKEVTRLSKVRSPSDLAWPLWLGPSIRVLVTNTLLSAPTTNTADLYIVKGMISELQHVAANGKVGTIFGMPATVARKIVPEIPVSLYDARIFLIAFSRLSRDDQTTNFISLLTSTETLIQISHENVNIENRPNLSLVGRLITLCSNAYCMMTFGASMRDKLLTVLESSITFLSWPPDRSMHSYTDSSSHRYMGILDDWANADIPLLAIPTIYTEVEEESVRIEIVLQKALQLGFSSAPFDSCHILFAAWNELGKRNLWGPLTTNICPFSYTSLTFDISSILIQLREEMCYVHWMLKRYHHESIPDSTLIRIIEKRHGAIGNCASSQRIKGLLKSMIDKATKLMGTIMDLFQQDDTSTVGDTAKFCLLEACTVYMAFAISSFTRPNSDFFTSTHCSMQNLSQSRPRGYSTDSDAIQDSDGGSDDSHDLMFATVGRIHDVYDCIGAVPAHPDWLDDECHLLESVSTREVAEISLKALTCLTEVLRSALINAQQSIRCLFCNLQNKNECKSGESVKLAGTLCLLNFLSMDHFDHDVVSQAGSLIGMVSGLDSSCLQSILSLRDRKGRASSTETKWCPHSSHRIQGSVHASFRSEVVRELSVEELKLCGEWEIIFASRLASASIKASPNAEYMAVSEHWLVLCETVLTSLAPTAALLRFSLYSSGKHPHPLSFIDNTTSDFSMEKCCGLSLGNSNLDITTCTLYHDAIISTLVVLSYFSWHRVSFTIASQLVLDPTAFYTLQGFVRYAYAIQAMDRLQGAMLETKEVLSAVPVLVEQAILTLKQWGFSTQVIGDDVLGKSFGCLVSCLLGYDYKNDFQFKSSLSKDFNPIDALSGNTLGSFLEWDWSVLHLNSIRCLTKLTFDDTLELSLEARSTVAFVMARVVTTYIDNERPEIFIEIQNVFVDTLNNIQVNSLEKIVREYVCSYPPLYHASDENENFGIRESYCSLLAFALLQSNAARNALLWARCIYDILIKSFEEKQSFADCVLDVTLLYATYFSKLDLVAAIAFNDKYLIRYGETMDIEMLKIIYKFVNFFGTFPAVAQARMQTESELHFPRKENMSISNNLPSCCSYVTDKDFHGQHWYNCYTCDLVNDKGCCTLCAIVCHQGHDVGYSRFSSFFCDCGGAEESGVALCKCLSPHARDAYLTKLKGPIKTLYQSITTTMCAKIINSTFPSNCVAAVQKIYNENVRSWLKIMFDQTKTHLMAWKALEVNNNGHLREKRSVRSYNEIDKIESNQLEYSVCSRRSQYFDDFSFFGETNTGIFQMSGHIHATTSLDRIHGSRSAGKDLTASILDADSRGRVAVADTNHVKFISGLSMLNSRCVENGGNIQSLKASLISTIAIGFAVKGLKFVPDFDNSIYVWGSEKAKVISMTDNLTMIVTEMDLAVNHNLDHERGEILNCSWIVGSGTCIAVACARHVFIFDISQRGCSIQPILTISSLVDDSSLYDFVVIRVVGNGKNNERQWKLYATLENRKLRVTTIRQDENGLISTTEVNDCIDAVVIKGSDLGNDSGSSSFVRSRNLYYFKKSNVLIYETDRLNVRVLFLTESGEVSRAATLLPFSFSVNSSMTEEDVTVHGPFTFWNEIKSIRRGNDDFFRAVCVGRLEKSNADVLISLEFNCDYNVTVQVMAAQHESTHSFIGLATYTAPMLRTESNASTIHREKQFSEHIVICALTGTGYLAAYVEKVGSLSLPILTPSCYESADDSNYYTGNEIMSLKNVEHSLNIVSIEDFINMTDSDDICYGGTDLGT